MLLRRVVVCVKSINQIISNNVTNVLEYLVMASMAVDDVCGSKALELGFVTADDDNGAEACEGGELGGKAAAVTSTADDEDGLGFKGKRVALRIPRCGKGEILGVEEAYDTWLEGVSILCARMNPIA